MKIMIAVLSLVVPGAVVASAQTTSVSSVPPDIIVIEKSWRVDYRNPMLDVDPFGANVEFDEVQRAQRTNDRLNASRAKGSESREAPPPRPKKASDSISMQPQVTYIYRAKVKNAGAKTIRVIEWGYVFVDSDTQKELGRHRYSSKVKLRAGQDDDLVGRSSSPQSYVVNVKNSDKGLSEQVIIYRVEYDDGSVWQNPSP